MFPTDLKRVVALCAKGGLSCSVVRPGDEFADLNRANATGCVGVILGLETKNSLIAAHPHDCGSMVENGVRKVLNEKDLTVDERKRCGAERVGFELTISAEGLGACQYG